MMGEAIARIELTSSTTAEELWEIMDRIQYSNTLELQRVPNPAVDEPDFYVNRAEIVDD